MNDEEELRMDQDFYDTDEASGDGPTEWCQANVKANYVHLCSYYYFNCL